MKLKSLLLGAAAVATAGTANAADLPVAPEPVDYVRICDAYGNGFFYIPGTETCLRVGGRVRAQVVIDDVMEGGDWSNRDNNGLNWLGRGYLYLDTRTATDFGTLRTFTDMNMSRSTGSSGSFSLSHAYIQWGGITAGYTGSNFDQFFPIASTMYGNALLTDTAVNQLAYTAAFGGGASFTIALEDGEARDTSASGGARVPDLVANLTIKQGWGSAGLSAAIHHVVADTATVGNANDYADIGYAIGGGVSVKLPTANSGSKVYLAGVYQNGSAAYMNASGDYTTDANGNIDLISGYSVVGGIKFAATDTIALFTEGQYSDLDNAADYTRYAVSGGVHWTPVSGLFLSAEVGYNNVEQNNVDTDQLDIGFRIQRTF